MYKYVVVIPNHLPHFNFLEEWNELKSSDVFLVIVQDIGEKPDVPEGFNNFAIYDHDDIEQDLKKKAWIIPTQSSACRSYGYYKAWQMQPEFILTLDNDCYPETDDYWLKGHELILNSKTTLDWVNTVQEPFLRGFPYLIRDTEPTVLNHGLWSNVPDLDGPTMLLKPDLRFGRHLTNDTIPRFNFFPMCGMNLAWKPELTPALYFGLFGPDYGFDQYDDIWAGVLMKKVVDHLRLPVRSGFPSVEHRKQSDAFVNLKKQAPGLAMNEEFWKAVQSIELTKDTIIDCYEELITKLPDELPNDVPDWLPTFKKAALLWLSLFR